MPGRVVALVIPLILWTAIRPAAAQSYTAATDLFFYGDNTEFANDYRRGETVFGASGRVFLEIALNEAVTLRAGFFGLGRFGAHEFLEHGEPLLALEVRRGPSRFVFGSLETMAAQPGVGGPDRETPHGLLPPLQQETLTFTRGQEMGLQWLVASRRLSHDVWINWQRINTAEHRERFDAGYRGAVGLTPAFALSAQWHLVHEGGQQFASGPVSDSQGAAVGAEWTRELTDLRLTLDAHAVATRDVPDRERLDLAENGAGIFTRAAIDAGPWRSHLVVWRGRDVFKAEGDANYLAPRLDGVRSRRTRDYGELGLTRHFRPAPNVHLFAAVRVHRIESTYEYSYRLAGRVRIRHRF